MGRRAPSLFRSVPWRRITKSAYDTGARTLAVAYATASPNMIVVGIDCARGQMLFHQIEEADLSMMTRHLGAEG